MLIPVPCCWISLIFKESKTTDLEEEVEDVETLDLETPRAAFSALKINE